MTLRAKIEQIIDEQAYHMSSEHVAGSIIALLEAEGPPLRAPAPEVEEVLADLDAMGEDLATKAATAIRLMRREIARADEDASAARALLLEVIDVAGRAFQPRAKQ